MCRGRLVQPDGSPANGIQLFAKFPVDSQKPRPQLSEFEWYDLVLSNTLHSHTNPVRRTNAQGEFQLKYLLPGVPIYVGEYAFDADQEPLSVAPLKPGEVRDLGTLKFRRRR